MFKNKKVLLSSVLAFVCSNMALASNVSDDLAFNIKVSKPTFVLPQFSGPYREREASIAPDEYENAERLRSLLENDNQAQVLKELETFYDIELSPAMLTLKAQIYFSMQKYQKAESLYLKVLARKPQLVRVHRDLGQLYLLQDEPKKAQKHFSKALSLGSNEAIVHGQLAYLNLTLNSPFSAISEYQQAMALEPNELQWQQGLFTALSQAKIYPTAQALLEEMLIKNPNEIDLWLNKAVLSLNQNKSKEALISLEMAILLGDKDDSNLKTAAQLHLQLQSYDRAFELISKHVNQKDLNTTTLNEYLTWLDQVEMWQEASQLLKKIEPKVKDLPEKEQSVLFVQTANINNKRKQLSVAERYYKKALDADPTNGDALLSYALFSSDKKAHIQAELLYIRAEAIPEFEKQALLGKAQLYLNMQNHEAALVQLQKAYAKYSDMAVLNDQIKVIKNIIRLKNKNQA